MLQKVAYIKILGTKSEGLTLKISKIKPINYFLTNFSAKKTLKNKRNYL